MVSVCRQVVIFLANYRQPQKPSRSSRLHLISPGDQLGNNILLQQSAVTRGSPTGLQACETEAWTWSKFQIMMSVYAQVTPVSQNVRIQATLNPWYQRVFPVLDLHAVKETGCHRQKALAVSTTAPSICCLQGVANQSKVDLKRVELKLFVCILARKCL